MNKNTSTGTGITVTGLLLVAFIVLKLTKVIDWSWWWVTCPAWGSIALFLVGALIYGIIVFIGYIIKKVTKRW